MELAIHLREPSQLETFEGLAGQLAELYPDGSLEYAFPSARFPDSFRRIYVGDEFCLHRLVDTQGLDAFIRMAEARSWAVTLLTPPVTDDGLERCASLFDRLDDPQIDAEVVVNDWGALEFLRERHPSLPVSLGRLLNKGFKDPRLEDPASFEEMSDEAADLLNRCTFDSPRFQEEMVNLRVSRFERDLLPYGDPRGPETDGLGTSVYFPFGYVTMGRVCWLASFDRNARDKFSLADTCLHTCREVSLRLTDAQGKLRLLQEGNAIFHLYPVGLLSIFLWRATESRVRCVYQGMAIGVS